MTANRSSDFSYPIELIGEGTCNVSCPIRTKPEIETNKHSIYYKLNENSLQTLTTYALSGYFYVNVPQSWFNGNNNVLTIQVDTYDANKNFITGSYSHSIPLYNSKSTYKNYVSNFLYPATTYPGEVCTVNILPPKDSYSNGLLYDIDINYHSNVGRQVLVTNRQAGKFSFVTPDLAINSSLTVRVTTKDKLNGNTLGVVAHSIKIKKSSLEKPKIILPDNYSLTLSEGEVVKVEGKSTNINDYMIIYARQSCDVAAAVSDYTTSSGYYAASKTDLKNKLMKNAKGDADFYILKDFDSNSTFMTQDDNDPHVFNIKTPSTKDYEDINDFYVLQWFKGVKPGDLVYIHAIERRKGKLVTETSELIQVGEYPVDKWWCRHCQLDNYKTWSISYNWSPYCLFDLNNIRALFTLYEKVSLTFCTDTNIKTTYPPDIYITPNKIANMNNNNAQFVLLTPLTGNNQSYHEYMIPSAVIENHLARGYTKVFFATHWGKNTNIGSCTFNKGYVRVNVEKPKNTEFSDADSSYYQYTDLINDISKTPLSTMTPYVVIPPAVRPVEITVKDKNTKQVTISYTNPLYGEDTKSYSTYTSIGNVVFDVSQGDDINNLSNLNPITDIDGNVLQIDKTLHVDINERRELTYENKITLPQTLIEKIKKVSSNEVFLDLNIKSIDKKSLNFKNITSNGVKLQLMLSKSNGDKIRALDFTSDIIDLKTSEYKIEKISLNKKAITNDGYNTIHLLYNADEYDQGKTFTTKNWSMMIDESRSTSAIGWKKFNNRFGVCTFESETFEIAKHALNYYNGYKLRLVLKNLSASSDLYHAPIVSVQHHNGITMLNPNNVGTIKKGEDIIYDIPNELYDISYDDTLRFTMVPQTPYPINLGDISFSSADIEAIGLDSIDQTVDKYSTGFTATVDFFSEAKQVSNNNVSVFDPVECIDIIMCCYDKNKKLINKATSKRRDIYNGKEFIHYSDRRWHSFVNDKYLSDIKYKKDYTMTFSIPSGTEYMYFVAFTYGNWHDNPSIYSMSNVLVLDSVKKDMAIEFLNPILTYDEPTNSYFANSDINNPSFKLQLNSEKSGNIDVPGKLENGFNLATDAFNINKWNNNPIIYSNDKKYGYELPNFDTKDLYIQNNVVSSLEPLYNDIEYYSLWESLYGTDTVKSIDTDINADSVDINSEYTIFEDEGDKFISDNAVPYIDIPANIINYDRSKITIFLDTDFGVGNVAETTKLVTETYTENYTITKIRNNIWGVKTLWTSKMMTALEDVAAIEDIKIEWGMKLNRNHTHPTEGRRGPILVEDLWVDSKQSYNYNPATKFPDECKGNKIKDYGGHDIWHKNYGDYIYFEITNDRLKRLFLECNCHRRRHDAILFEDYQYDWCWDTTVKVKFTVTRRVKEDGSRIYKHQNLPSEHYSSATWVNGWATYSMPQFKTANVNLVKAPTDADPSFIMRYDVMLSPVVFYYLNNPITGDSMGNIYKYSWGDNPEAFMKWETVTVSGRAPYTHTQTHYYIAYNEANTVYKTFTFDITKDGAITQR